MKSTVAFAFSLLALGLAGCGTTASNAARLANADAEASGSPFRWTSQSVSGGSVLQRTLIELPSAPSRADAVLTRDTLALIAKSETAAGRPYPQVEDIKMMKDNREVCILKSASGGLAYVVVFTPSPAGGVDIGLQGPQLYSR